MKAEISTPLREGYLFQRLFQQASEEGSHHLLNLWGERGTEKSCRTMERWPFLQQTLEEVLGRVTLPCHSKVLGCLLWESSESASIRPLQDPFSAYLLFSSKRRTM